MAVQITLKVNGNSYHLGCDENQAEYLQSLASEIDAIVSRCKAEHGQAGDSRMLLLAALEIMDSLVNTQAEIASLTNQLEQANQKRKQQSEISSNIAQKSIDSLQRRIKNIHAGIVEANEKLKIVTQSAEEHSLETQAGADSQADDNLPITKPASKKSASRKPKRDSAANQDVQLKNQPPLTA